ncbi:MAG: acetyl-CoA acetyltransferase [Syntrophaceae bacterium CG2_30_49_12]|nr:MAG: acetyl-CoA acetyltransferase [Syntrophaceae bacterium CG2_30_49_12]PIP06812.1 MAG: acetyl-CoA acetyltransferase [Syntrophobacterales bacterium CG23_combo_of_CG06-09_8_20_14_all_48_27]PJA50133.1 MAG: acetyl-CoA acetyltransferase [Syntrophobacterales bacterium CG_4_9_14_3_um_filter_49_8]PJC74385.1 MAG: acetyl-CoA acetyltransferase [Syntrophobacterales bacterium CG_4_8_14_3_um_filter_49_14]
MSGSIRDRVAIVGMGCTRFGELWDKSASDLVVEASYEAFEDAGIEPKDIQAAWVGASYDISAKTGMGLTAPLRLQGIPVTRIENACATGTDTFRNACYAVAAGIYDVVLALGVEKIKDMGFSGLGVGYYPGVSNTQPMLTAPGAFAILATRYFEKYGLSYEEGKRALGAISVKSHANGYMNPRAHFKNKVTLEQVVNAPIIAEPLGLFDCCGVSDGAAAAIITRAEMAKNFRPDPIYVKALQISVSADYGRISTGYDFTEIKETYTAGQRAYEEAGIRNPREEISMAEVHDCFSITELVTMEDLQFSPRGRAREDIEAGFFNLDGGLPVQPDGGLKCFGHPVGASGLRMLYEMYLQLQGRAEKRQIKNPRLGLTHNLGGQPGGCTISVCIVGTK